MDQLSNYKAMVFAAGLGTRLRPLTLDRPKALVELAGKSLLEIQLRRLAGFGIREAVVNIHHFPDKMKEAIARMDIPKLSIVVSDESGELLETGGGLLKAAPLLRGAKGIVMVNVDILTDLNLPAMATAFEESDALALLAVRDRSTSRYLVWNEDWRLTGWINRNTGETRGTVHPNDFQRAFSGIHIIRPDMLDQIRNQGKFSIVDTYLDLAPDWKIQAYPHDQDRWLDVGKPEALRQANDLFVDFF